MARAIPIWMRVPTNAWKMPPWSSPASGPTPPMSFVKKCNRSMRFWSESALNICAKTFWPRRNVKPMTMTSAATTMAPAE